MTEDRLRSWLLGELDEDAALEVARWVVCCTDPRLPDLLQGILRAHADETADRRLSRLDQAWARLVSGWNQLLEVGSASLVGGPTMVLASSGVPGLELYESDSGHRLRAPARANHSLVLTDDTGDLVVLGAGADVLDVALPPAGARPVAWWLEGELAALTAVELAEAVDAGRVLQALRIEVD